MNIGLFLKNRREELELSQREVADLIGVSKSIISRWENNEVKNIGVDNMQKLLKVLSIDTLSFLNIPSNSSPNSVSCSEYPYIPNPVVAGIPQSIEALTELPQIAIPDELLGKYANNKNIIIMKVNGESMNRVIENGSIIGVLTDIDRYSLKNGDIVVFNHDYEYSLKRFYNLGDKIIFKPDSTDMRFTDIVYNSDDVISIVGKVIMNSYIYD